MIKFIADIGSNHNKDLARTYRLIDAAKSIGCDAVKFQLFKGERLYAPEFPDKIAQAQANELPPEFIPKISDYCRQVKIEFHCTPFCTDDVYALRAWVDAYKIASFSILDLRLIKIAAGQGLPIGISTGGATNDEIKGALRIAIKEIYDMTKIMLYHCIPIYPSPTYPGMMNRIMADGYFTGYSDHTGSILAIISAIARNATIIEFHLDLNDRAGAESVHGHCWATYDAGQMITAARDFDIILNGDEKVIDYSEMRKWRNDPDDEMRPLKQYREELC